MGVNETFSSKLEAKEKALRAIKGISPTSLSKKLEHDFLFRVKQTEAGKKLPEPYLVYFLLVELLGFKDLGKFEKLAWSVPIDFEGETFLIEHRKFGIGIFCMDPVSREHIAQKIVNLIQKGIKVAMPYFESIAISAAKGYKINVFNVSRNLFDRYQYLYSNFSDLNDEAIKRKDEYVKTQHSELSFSISYPSYEIRKRAEWYALSAIEAFFSWTEHVFIHIAILSCKIKTGEDVVSVASKDWAEKYKLALPLAYNKNKYYYDQLNEIKSQIRNFVAHGAFGKGGEAFYFHSNAGAVPVRLNKKGKINKLSLFGSLNFENAFSLKLINEFTEYIWQGKNETFGMYISEACLPSILTMVHDGTYEKATSSKKNMERLTRHLSKLITDSTNMDW